MNTPKLTKEQAAIIGLYTGVTCGPFSDIHEYAEKLIGGPIYTHLFTNTKFVEELKEKSKPDFLAICFNS
jgi:hypothetical protein